MKPDNCNNNNSRRPPKKKQEGKVRTKLEEMQCALMATNAANIFNHLYTKYYEQLIPILMADEQSIFYDISLE